MADSPESEDETKQLRATTLENQILTETLKEILYAAADAEKISEYIFTIEQKREISQTQEATALKQQISYAERTYLAVPYDERPGAKAIGARRDAVKKAWYVGPGVEPEKTSAL